MVKTISNPKPVVVTTSWDDDAAVGLKVADLLAEHGLRGTFYVPTGELAQRSHFTHSDLRQLADGGFEIGAHTISHRLLTELSPEELSQEVGECKTALEQIVGRDVSTFCYPKGRFNSKVIHEVERAGYRGARTTRMLSTEVNFAQFEMPTTIQAYPHKHANYLRNLVRLGGVPAVVKSTPDLLSLENWLELGKRLFDRVLHDGGVWHLYGHPWEIERLNLWSQLAEMLYYVSHRENVAYLTNAQLLLWRMPGNAVRERQRISSREHTLIH